MSEDEIISAVVKGVAKAMDTSAKAASSGSGFGATEIWGLLGALVTAFGGVVTVLIRMYAKSKDSLRDVFEAQIKALERRVEDKEKSSTTFVSHKDEEIDRLVTINHSLQEALDAQRRERVDELKGTAPLVANAIHKSTEAQNKSADAQLKLADAFTLLHREIMSLREDLTRASEERNRGR